MLEHSKVDHSNVIDCMLVVDKRVNVVQNVLVLVLDNDVD